MMLLRHVGGLLGQVIRFAIKGRRVAILLLVVLGLLLAAAIASAQVASVYVLYPFAVLGRTIPMVPIG